MTNQEFKALEQNLERATNYLETLKKQYKDETGKTYVPPIRLDKPVWARRAK